MERRTLLATVGTLPVASAGCLGDLSEDQDPHLAGEKNSGDSDEGSVVARVGSDVSRPECKSTSETIEIETDGEANTFETAATIPYPAPLTTFTQDAVVEYVETFENAYVTKNILCDRKSSGHIFGIDYSVRERETFDWYDDIEVVFLLRIGAASSGSDGDGNIWVADVDASGVVYAIDESGVARIDFDDVHMVEQDEYESHAPDPLDNGNLVATFE